jgi:hypothetical protein
MARRGLEPRTDAHLSDQIDRALQLARTEGIGSALDFMLTIGVPRPVALRVLTSPSLLRRHERRKIR